MSNRLLGDITMRKVSALYRQAANLLRLPRVPVLHQLRHGGASYDYTEKSLSPTEIQVRGRWASERSTRRYQKSGRINEQLAEMETSILGFCEESFKNIEGILDGSSTPSLPP